MRKLILSMAMLTVLNILILSCSFNVTLDPNPRITESQERYQKTAGLYIDKQLLFETIDYDKVCLLGYTTDFSIPAGEGLQTAAEKTLLKIFSKVRRLKLLKDSKNYDLVIILRPYAKSIYINHIVRTEFILNAVITDKKNDIIYNKEFMGETRGYMPTLKGCCIFLWSSAVAESVNTAYEDAFEKFYKDLINSPEFNKFMDGQEKKGD